MQARLRKAVTDPQKVRRNDPGRPEICLVYTYHQKFNPENAPEIEAGCRSGALGCVECKLKCSGKISEFIEPIRQKRLYFEDNISEVESILADGEKRAKIEAEKTMDEVHSVMKFG